jgi:hypothetical protein
MEIGKGVTMLVHSEPYELLILGCGCNPSNMVVSASQRFGKERYQLIRSCRYDAYAG